MNLVSTLHCCRRCYFVNVEMTINFIQVHNLIKTKPIAGGENGRQDRNSLTSAAIMESLYVASGSDVKQRLRPFGFFMEKSLKDLIKGIRTHNETSEQLSQFLSHELEECHREAGSADLAQKTNAVLKLTYLEMYGFDMSWCNFHVLEVMSSMKLQEKRVGYLAASQSFYGDNDVLMLATNLLKKDLRYSSARTSDDVIKMGVALSGLTTMVTPALAADIVDDLFMILSSSNPYIRKKAVTALYKVFLEHPESLRDNFDQFAAKLEDSDISVVSATVTVICELSKKNPAPFLPLSPLLYQILVEIDNNWIIIRLLKLFTNLSRFEPKLVPKLLPKIIELMESTSATSVIYESINCIVKGNMIEPDDYNTTMFCLEKLHRFCSSQDPNLRYISCVLFYKIGKINTDFISQFEELIIKLLNDIDVTIRAKALELLGGIVDEDNIKSIVTRLIQQFVEEDFAVIQNTGSILGDSKPIPMLLPDYYKRKVIHTILDISAMNDYANILDFEWYCSVLLDLAVLSQDLLDENLGYRLGESIRNFMVKVPSMRGVAMVTVINLITNPEINKELPSVLKGCIWCLGEYSNLIENGDSLIEIMIKRGHEYSNDIQSILVVALMKVFSSWSNTYGRGDVSQVVEVLNDTIRFYETLCYSSDYKVQERSIEAYELLKICLEAIDKNENSLPILITEVLPSLFNVEEFKPVAPGTQARVQDNTALDFTTPILNDAEKQDLLSKHSYHDMIESFNDRISDTSGDNDDDDDNDDAYENQALKDCTSDHDYTKKTAKISSIPSDTASKRVKQKDRDGNPYYLNAESLSLPNNQLTDGSDSEKESNNKEAIQLVKIHDQKAVDFSDAELRIDRDVDKKKKKKKKKKTKVQVLPDTAIDEGVSSMPQPIGSQSSFSSLAREQNTRYPRISLQKPSKLESFDFSKNSSPNAESDEELKTLRKKFAEQKLDSIDQSIRNDEGGEVVVIKKKHKIKSRSRSENADDKKKLRTKKVKETLSQHGTPEEAQPSV